MLEIVVTHQTRHGRQVRHLAVVAAEDLRARRHLPGHGLGLPLDHLRRVAALVVDVLEVGDVVRRPVCLLAQPGGHVAAVAAAGDLLEDEEGAVAERLERRELVVIEHHPLVVVQPAVVQRVPLHPLLRRGRQAVGQRRPRPLQHALRFDVLVQRLVPDRDGGLLDRQPRRRDVEVIAGGEPTRVGGHGHLVTRDEGAVAQVQAQVVRLVDAVHRLRSRPGHVREEHVLVVRENLD